MLVTFGTFWGAEGAGVHWPGSDLMILGVLGFYAALSFVLVEILNRRGHRAELTGTAHEPAAPVRAVLVRLRGRRRLAPRVGCARRARPGRVIAHAGHSAWIVVPGIVGALLSVSVLRATPKRP